MGQIISRRKNPYRNAISLPRLFKMFPNDAAAEKWFFKQRWKGGMRGLRCAWCEGKNVVAKDSHPTMPYRCYDCNRFFSVKSNTVMQSSKIGYQKWAIAMYVMTTNLKGVSSTKLARDLEITQKSAWHMVHRIRESWADKTDVFGGPVEVDEAYIGGTDRNRHEWKVKEGRGPKGKAPVLAMKDRESGKVAAEAVETADKQTLQGFVEVNNEVDATVYTDEAIAYDGLPRVHETVKHSVNEFVRGQAHTNGVESFWATLKRGYIGVYHHFSVKHLQRYVNEFAGRHNDRPLDTIDQLRSMARGMRGKRLRYADLIAPE
ncbi:MAG: IS1595 family transposase [Chloroflexi bacterium]|nr:IS1595 family transposase [Chloroflexota bacterium]MYF78414.1 IS1595 family transposase [Chloroflexota bacterium]MYK62161.1 IS1595 family transposase [Chloroflexota bacterium]